MPNRLPVMDVLPSEAGRASVPLHDRHDLVTGDRLPTALELDTSTPRTSVELRHHAVQAQPQPTCQTHVGAAALVVAAPACTCAVTSCAICGWCGTRREHGPRSVRRGPALLSPRN